MTRQLQADAVIIGGGIVGGSAALFMRQAGLSVILLDKGFCGAQASGVNYVWRRSQAGPRAGTAAACAAFAQIVSASAGTDRVSMANITAVDI